MSKTVTRQMTGQKSLTQIGFNSFTEYSHSYLSSEDESKDPQETPDIPHEDAQSVVGVSIGQAQTHFASPKTPAAEKAAALEDIDGGGFFAPVTAAVNNDNASGVQLDKSVKEGEWNQIGTPSLPSPWRAGPKVFQRQEETKSVLRTGTNARPRSQSGGPTTESLWKFLPFSFPSLPRGVNCFQLPNIAGGSEDASSSRNYLSRSDARKVEVGQSYGNQSTAEGASKDTQQMSSTFPTKDGSFDKAPTKSQEQEQDQDTRIKESPAQSRSSLGSRNSSLRRTRSDDSLFLKRALSTASSLGDDARFENVSGQVNSRLKAIKDSWQDTNFKFPTISSFPFAKFLQEIDGGPSYGKARGSVVDIAPQNGNSSKPSLVQRDSGSAEVSIPSFSDAIKQLTGDLVILGGYRGSVLRSAEPPHRQLWVPVKVGLNLRKVDLEVGLNSEDEENMRERIIPGGMLKNIGPVDMGRRLFKRLRASDNVRNRLLRVHDYGYDWRLSPHILSRQLIEFLEKLPCNRPEVRPDKRGATVIAHSLGGLITRHAVNLRPDLFAGVVYAGVPTTCVNILGPLRNGDDVLFSSRVLTAQVNFTIRTSFALLPLEGSCFINKKTKEEYVLDFFNPQTWIDHCLSPCVATPSLPPETSGGITINGIFNSMSNALPSLPMAGRKSSISRGSLSTDKKGESADSREDFTTKIVNFASKSAESAKNSAERSAAAANVEPQIDKNSNPDFFHLRSSSVSTAVTIPREAAIKYLTRTLAETKAFKEALAYNPSIGSENRYPPAAVMYGKSTPTVYGAKVESKEAIKLPSAFDDLAFASGDGVVLARAAMLPEGYLAAKGGVVSTDRGHVTLLGDLEAVGKCLRAVAVARNRGVGLGNSKVVPSSGAKVSATSGED